MHTNNLPQNNSHGACFNQFNESSFEVHHQFVQLLVANFLFDKTLTQVATADKKKVEYIRVNIQQKEHKKVKITKKSSYLSGEEEEEVEEEEAASGVNF